MQGVETLIDLMKSEPQMLLALLPIAVLILVNGLTDAPVNIATAVNSGAITPKKAVLMSAFCNFFGAVASGGTVAISFYSLSGLATVGRSALPALTASAIAVSAWALFALYLGLPTSESHALSAALTGAAVSVGGLEAVNGAEWLKLLLGLVLSTLPVAVVAYFAARYFKNNIDLTELSCKRLQIFGAALSSFAHGSQDGQKFAGVLAISMSFYRTENHGAAVPTWCFAASAVLISVGTLIGGSRILKTFGTFAPRRSDCGFAADFVSATALSALAFLGIPAATTHAKTSAVFGAGRVLKTDRDSTKTAVKMVIIWTLTFPLCAVLGYLITRLLIFTEIF